MDYQIFIYDVEELRIKDYFGCIWQLMEKKIIEIKVIKNQLMFIYMWKILKLLKLQLLEF